MHSLLLLLLVNQFLHLYQFYCNAAFIISNPQKDFYQDNVAICLFAIYKDNYLNILGDISDQIQAKNQ